MSKAEEKALEAYPKKIEWVGNQWDGAPFDVNSKSRVAYEQGYQQAERDLELTWEDMAFIRVAFDALEANIHLGAIKIQPMTKEYYEEVLKRFKDYKERKGNTNGK